MEKFDEIAAEKNKGGEVIANYKKKVPATGTLIYGGRK
jgi:hypothetical protein